ncbi:uncharacterized protein TNIN_402641 [Trichonephila inaurata madagascariensis]|uniref:Uncharacterized protein n=1 Tax=Trichonephila inaurata madagascariensis TaxID=2747483 RepID=A0A8X6X097_9ARAC|nr:uncharacterized protein TNIN_402641 [Trichonephila inaurata madagascariensis]
MIALVSNFVWLLVIGCQNQHCERTRLSLNSNEAIQMMMMINMMKSLSHVLKFFFHLAWESRVRLPVLLTVWFMVLDVRMQLEINVNLGQNQIDA